MEILRSPEALATVLGRTDKAAVIVRDEDAFKALGQPLRAGHVAAQARVGHRIMFLLTSWNPEAGGVPREPSPVTVEASKDQHP